MNTNDNQKIGIERFVVSGLKRRTTLFCHKERSRSSFFFIFILLLLVFSGARVGAQTPKPTAQPNVAPTAQPSVTPSPSPEALDYHKEGIVVTEVYNLLNERTELEGEKKSREAALNDIIIVKVRKLENLLKASKCEAPYDPPKCEKRPIVLFINGREIKGLQPESGAPKLDAKPEENPDGELRYHLQRITGSDEEGEDNKEHWADLLGLRVDDVGRDPWKRPVEVSVGLAGDYPVQTEVKREKQALTKDKQFDLIRVRGWWLLIWVGITLAIIIILYLLANKSNILRDRAPVLYGQKQPYSLSAFQAAWWFSIILIAFIFIWLVTGQYDFSTTALILLSIGLGTTVGSNLIDANKRNTSDDAEAGNLKLLLADKKKLEEELKKLDENTDAYKTKKDEYNTKIGDIQAKFPNAIGPPHKSFLMDIMSDANGVSFHRFQMLVWTLILSFFFIISALGRLAMPQFSEALLALMGVSAGTFLAFKIPENNTAPTQPTNNGNGGGGGAAGGGAVGGNGAIAKIEIDPASASLSEASPTQQLSAKTTDAQNNAITPDNFSPQWSSDNASVATVDQTGLVTRVGVGNCNVTAIANGVTSNNCAVTCS